MRMAEPITETEQVASEEEPAPSLTVQETSGADPDADPDLASGRT